MVKSSQPGLNEDNLSGDIEGALQYFHSQSRERDRRVFRGLSPAQLQLSTSQIPGLSPVLIQNHDAHYSFVRQIRGATITFPVDFGKENGLWRVIMF
jgi:hypothetical protein